MTALTVPDVLRLTEQKVAGRWGQGSGRHRRGQLCVLDALDKVTGGGAEHLFVEAYKALLSEIGEPFAAAWNDREETTEAEVRAALLAAAQRAEAGT